MTRTVFAALFGVLPGVLLVTVALAAPTKELVTKQMTHDPEALRPLFAADALVVLPAGVTTGALPNGKLRWFLSSNEAYFNDSTAGKLTTGTRGDVSWVALDFKQPYRVAVDCPPESGTCDRKRTLRMTELIVGGKGVAAHIDDPARGKREPAASVPIAPSTDAGPLTAMLADPTALAAALLDDPATSVFGTEEGERAVGLAASKKLVTSWSKLSLAVDGKPREVRTATWGYAAANVAWKSKTKTITMRATVFAVMVGTAWKAVAVHYSLPYERVMYE